MPRAFRRSTRGGAIQVAFRTSTANARSFGQRERNAASRVLKASPVAYSPVTKLFYASTNSMCMDYAALQTAHLKGTPFMGINSPYHAGSDSRFQRYRPLACRQPLAS